MKLEGLRETQRALQRLPDALQKELITAALIDAAQPMRDMAAELAPDAPPIGVGLSDNIIVSDKLTAAASQEEQPARRDEVKVYVGVDGLKPGIAPHGILNEFGTGPRYHESGKYVGEMPAQPFMRPAFDGTARTVIRRFARSVKVIVENAARRLRRT